MKTISAGLQAYLNLPTVPIAILVRVDRKDGVSLGFTSWDTILVYGGLTYWPTISLIASAIKSNSDLTTDQLDVKGSIDSTLITEADLDAGRYDKAQVIMMRCNPLDLTVGVIVDLVGQWGDMTFGEEGITLAVNSLGARANQQFGDVISTLCRVRQLGDSQCKVNLSSFQSSSAVTVVVSDMVLRFTDSHAAGYYNNGKVIFKSLVNGGGANHDLAMDVKKHIVVSGQAELTLHEPMPFQVNVGDTVTLEAGCDRRAITCRSKFSNLVNFHAEPYVPGNDALLKTGRPPS